MTRSAAIVSALDEGEDELGQVLALHRAAGIEQPERLALGAGDRLLLRLHEKVTGRAAEVTVTCGACETVNAVALTAETVPAARERMRPLGRGGGLREPAYADLRDLPADAGDASTELLRRCRVGSPEHEPSADDLELVDDSLAGPLCLTCVGCGAAVEAVTDVERLVLELLQRHAHDVETEVHLLASAYHWELGTIEELPDNRRERLARLVAEGR